MSGENCQERLESAAKLHMHAISSQHVHVKLYFLEEISTFLRIIQGEFESATMRNVGIS